VGISIFPGQDLSVATADAVGAKLASVLNQNGVDAQCFVHNEVGSKGTGFNFKIDGLTWSESGPLDISEATSANTLKAVLAEAKTAKALLSPAALP